jgi:hypothetical protein
LKRQKREKIYVYKQKSENIIIESDRKIETEIIERNRTEIQKMSRIQPTAVGFEPMQSTSVTIGHTDKELVLCSSVSNEPASCETTREKLATAYGG